MIIIKCIKMKKLLYLIIYIFILLPLSAEELNQPKIGLVLSGGGAKGFAHIGMLKVIDELNIEIDYIFGTSMGAIIGGLYASGYSALEIEKIVTRINWEDLLTDKVARNDLYIGQKKWLPSSNITFNLDKRFKPSLPQGLIIGNNIHLQFFYETWRVAHINNFSQLPLPFVCTGTNLENGSLKIFENGSLADALRASSSIPSVFMPMEINNQYFIDGGIAQNFPADIADQYGMNFIIGLKSNTKLSKAKDLKNIVQILNQTIGIGMQYKQSPAELFADILLFPDTEQFSTLEFDKAQEIIDIGYYEALKHYNELQQLSKFKQRKNHKFTNYLPEKIEFKEISILNNRYLSNSTVEDYVGLKINRLYSKDDLIENFKKAYASELFDQIYPRINQKIDKKGNTSYYELIIVVKEKPINQLSFNITYNQDIGLTASTVLSLKNYLIKNSNVFINTSIGGKQEFCIDFVKNILKDYTLYYRFFPYVKEEQIYTYDDNHYKTKSYNALELGATTGIGLYPVKNLTIEPYLYHFQLKFSRDIADDDLFDKTIYSSGGGIKFYYESLDDYPFYTKGIQSFTKYITAQKGKYSELGYKKLQTQTNIAIPINQKFTILVSGEYGTYFKTEPLKEDPFYIGGIDKFIGLNSNEISAPFYRISTIGIRIMPLHRLFVDIKANHLTYGNTDKWVYMDESLFGFGIVAGYKTPIAPIKVGLGVNQNSTKSNSKSLFTYISFGYDYDAFFFSKR